MIKKDVLKRSQQRKKIICIYTNKDDTESFFAGYVQCYKENAILINHINQFGFYNGYIIKNIDDIYLIEEDSKYIKKIEILYRINGKPHKSISIDNDDLQYSLLRFAKENSLIVSIQLVDSGYTDVQGFVKEIVKDNVAFLQLNDHGEDNGSAYFNIGDITHITCNSDSEQALKIMFEENK